MNVRYCSTHYNHDLQLAFLKMPSNARLDIARKLQIGVAVERILDDIRDTCDGGINREHLITRQDIRYIKLYNIEGVMRYKNDLNSVIVWVREMQSTLGYNPVLLFKEQGTEQPQGLDNFSDNDFILCLQTQFQRDMFTELGSNVVCADATHGTNMYDFQLITIIVMDEYGEGLPVGWMISNREDAIALNAFFTAIKQACGNIKPIWFKSDDAQQYFNAWKGVFGEQKIKKIICTWHIHRSWRRAHIKTKEDQITIYHSLCVLLQEHKEPNFRTLLQALLTHLHNTFYNYFNSTYCFRLEEWAVC